jgi:hypothetical protein
MIVAIEHSGTPITTHLRKHERFIASEVGAKGAGELGTV